MKVSKKSISVRSATKTSDKKIFKEVGSIVIFTLGVISVLSLLTYQPGDPSLFSASSAPARNACGWIGAYVAALLLQGIGLAAFGVPAALIFLAATIQQGEGIVRFIGTLAGMAVAVVSLTVFLAFQWQYVPYAGDLILTGGAFGGWIAELLRGPLNPIGASIVALVTFLIALVLSTPVTVSRFFAQTFSLTWRALIKTGRLVGTTAVYLGGIALMKGAHALGDTIHRFFEAALRRARERAIAMRSSRAISVDNEVLAPAGSAPVIRGDLIKGPQLPLSLSDDPDAIDPDALEAAADNGSFDDEDEEEVSVIRVSALAANEAAFDDDEKSDAVAAIAKAGGAPTILPRSKDDQEKGKRQEAAKRAAEKLAKAASSRHGQWKLPTIEFLKKAPKTESKVDREKLIQNSHILKQKLASFGIDGDVTAVRPGPVITLYEFRPGPGVKVSRIAALSDDLSMALSAQSVRILAPLPGKSVVGIEIPSDERETVLLREFLEDPDFYGDRHQLPVTMGKDISGKPMMSDLARMPHVLCAGQTGSGKSVFMNGLICSLLYRFTPDDLRMILVDPKFIEFRSYEDIPHLLLPVVDDPNEASIALKWAVREMERRYRILAMMGARNLASFNRKVEEMGDDVVADLLMSEENQTERMAKLPGGDWVQAFELKEDGTPRIGKLPFIVVIIDELADLMMIAKKDVEISIARIAQKARAAGIHLVIATQRPSTDVVTGLIKANLPSRVSFQLASFVDSKTILDRAGAERLLGQGDMLFIPPGISQAVRVHGAYVSDDEINKITSFLRSQGKPAYRDEILVDDESDLDGSDEDTDTLFDEAVELVKRSGHASASFLQRHLKVGYNRAARMIEDMESRGIVGPPDGSRPREVLLR